MKQYKAYEVKGFMNAYINSPSDWQILQTAESLFQSKGFDKTTIEDIAGQRDIYRSIFYHHFDSLDQVLEILWSGSLGSQQ